MKVVCSSLTFCCWIFVSYSSLENKKTKCCTLVGMGKKCDSQNPGALGARGLPILSEPDLSHWTSLGAQQLFQVIKNQLDVIILSNCISLQLL